MKVNSYCGYLSGSIVDVKDSIAVGAIYAPTQFIFLACIVSITVDFQLFTVLSSHSRM